MKYLKLFENFLSEKRDSPYSLTTLINIIPKTVDHRIIKFILDNWGDTNYKSPYSFSYYSGKVSWTYKEDKSYRLSDHWNFISQGKKHCETTTPVNNNTHWTIAQYDSNTNKYNIIMSLPFVKNIEINKKIAKTYKENHLKDYTSDLEKNNRYIHSIMDEIDLYINGDRVKLLSLGSHSIKYEKNGEKYSMNYKNFPKISYEGYYKGNLIIKKVVNGGNEIILEQP